jgi:hypothetical protein
MSDAVLDLDVLRPKKRRVKLGGKTIDVSFVPLGITFDLEDVMQEIYKLDQKAVKEGGAEARKAFDLTVRMCAVFCSVDNPEMDEAWFRSNVDAVQLHGLANEIRRALNQAYEGIDLKNAEAVQGS